MAEFVLAGQRGTFGQGVGQGAEFERFEQSEQVSADRVGGCTVGGHVSRSPRSRSSGRRSMMLRWW